MSSFNIIILGDGGVGKSSITLRFYEDRFEDEYHPTVEDAFTMEKMIDREIVRLEVVDTAGQEGFHHLREMYMSTEGAGYILAYAINLRDSFLSLTVSRIIFVIRIWFNYLYYYNQGYFVASVSFYYCFLRVVDPKLVEI